MTIDTSRTIEIESAPRKLLLLVGLGLFMTAGGAVLAFGGLPGRGSTPYAHFIGYVSVVFFGAVTILALSRLVTRRGPVITITTEGICDRRVAGNFIPWRAVTRISTWRFQRQSIMVLTIDPAIEPALQLTRVARWSRGANRAVGIDGLSISAQGLKTDHDTLLATAMAYMQAAHAGARVQKPVST